MSRTVFYCRCGARIVGSSERFEHHCESPRILPPLSPELDPIADPREITTPQPETSCVCGHAANEHWAWSGECYYEQETDVFCACRRFAAAMEGGNG